MGMKLEIYPACLDCAWRDLRVDTIYASRGTYDVEVCDKAPVCKLIVGQRAIEPDGAAEGGESE